MGRERDKRVAKDNHPIYDSLTVEEVTTMDKVNDEFMRSPRIKKTGEPKV